MRASFRESKFVGSNTEWIQSFENEDAWEEKSETRKMTKTTHAIRHQYCLLVVKLEDHRTNRERGSFTTTVTTN